MASHGHCQVQSFSNFFYVRYKLIESGHHVRNTKNIYFKACNVTNPSCTSTVNDQFGRNWVIEQALKCLISHLCCRRLETRWVDGWECLGLPSADVLHQNRETTTKHKVNIACFRSLKTQNILGLILYILISDHGIISHHNPLTLPLFRVRKMVYLILIVMSMWWKKWNLGFLQ